MFLPRKYNILTSDNLRSKEFIVTNSDNLSENCQLLRDIDFSVLANEEDILKLRLYDKKKNIIAFDYIANKENPRQTFTNQQIKLTITFSYQQYIQKNKVYMLCCPSFTIIKHPEIWSKNNHYGQCGQSCPCCRAHVGDTLGACPICNSPKQIISS